MTSARNLSASVLAFDPKWVIVVPELPNTSDHGWLSSSQRNAISGLSFDDVIDVHECHVFAYPVTSDIGKDLIGASSKPTKN
jgi:hypothetical protein